MFDDLERIEDNIDDRVAGGYPIEDLKRLKAKKLKEFNDTIPSQGEKLYPFECSFCEDNGWVLEGKDDDTIERPCPECQVTL